MMMKAEMAREMMRSRSQTPNPDPTRSGDDVGGTTTTPLEEAAAPASLLEPGAVGFSSMPALLYTELACVRQSHCGHLQKALPDLRYFRCSRRWAFIPSFGLQYGKFR